jgi:RNA polymerase sigma-70 factor (ECF subfamily)
MNDQDRLATSYEEHRPRLRAVAYRMLGSLSEADDALQDAWLRMSRADPREVDHLERWMTTVVARVCLNMLRSRRRRPSDSLDVRLSDRILDDAAGVDPEHEVLLADSVGLALLIVLDTLTPAQRLAFVLHDSFGLPFDEIAQIIGRSPMAARKLASRARRRVRGQAPVPDADLGHQRDIVQAFLAAARGGDFEALLAVLDPDVIVRVDWGHLPGRPTEVRGADAVARQAVGFARAFGGLEKPALVNGMAGVVVVEDERLLAVLRFTVKRGRIAEIDILRDPARLVEHQSMIAPSTPAASGKGR